MWVLIPGPATEKCRLGTFFILCIKPIYNMQSQQNNSFIRCTQSMFYNFTHSYLILKYKILHRRKQVLAVNKPYTLVLKTNNSIFWIIVYKSRTEQEVRINQHKLFAIYTFKSEMARKAEIVRVVKPQHPYCCPQRNCECSIYSIQILVILQII